MNKIKIAVVEDSKTLQERFVEGFELEGSFNIVGKFSNGESIVTWLEKTDRENFPDIILMDIEMPKKNGIEATREIKQIFPDLDIMMLTIFEDDEKIFNSIQAGASGYMLKDEPLETIIESVKELYDGGAPISRALARKVLSLLKIKPDENLKSKDIEIILSTRELELLDGLVNGGSYSSLAKELFISPHTVKTHIKNIYKKLHVHNRAEAVRARLGKL